MWIASLMWSSLPALSRGRVAAPPAKPRSAAPRPAVFARVPRLVASAPVPCVQARAPARTCRHHAESQRILVRRDREAHALRDLYIERNGTARIDAMKHAGGLAFQCTGTV